LNGTLFSKHLVDWFNKRTHPSEHRNGHQLSMKCALDSDQSTVSRLRQGGVPEGAVH